MSSSTALSSLTTAGSRVSAPAASSADPDMAERRSGLNQRMPKRPTVVSAGLLLFRRTSGALEVFLVHPGGPFWKHRDAGAWSIPKGEIAANEEPLAAACREFDEETGF